MDKGPYFAGTACGADLRFGDPIVNTFLASHLEHLLNIIGCQHFISFVYSCECIDYEDLNKKIFTILTGGGRGGSVLFGVEHMPKSTKGVGG